MENSWRKRPGTSDLSKRLTERDSCGITALYCEPLRRASVNSHVSSLFVKNFYLSRILPMNIA